MEGARGSDRTSEKEHGMGRRTGILLGDEKLPRGKARGRRGGAFLTGTDAPRQGG